MHRVGHRVGDSSATALQQVWDDRARGQHEPREVHVKRALPDAEGDREEIRLAVDTEDVRRQIGGIHVQTVDRAVPVECMVDERAHGAVVGYVELE